MQRSHFEARRLRVTNAMRSGSDKANTIVLSSNRHKGVFNDRCLGGQVRWRRLEPLRPRLQRQVLDYCCTGLSCDRSLAMPSTYQSGSVLILVGLSLPVCWAAQRSWHQRFRIWLINMGLDAMSLQVAANSCFRQTALQHFAKVGRLRLDLEQGAMYLSSEGTLLRAVHLSPCQVQKPRSR